VAKVRLGYDVTPFFVNADNEAVYLSSRIQREGVGATLWRIHDGNVGMYRQSVESCKPQYSLVNETRKFATIVCRNKAIHFAPDKTLISKSPFRPRTAYYDKTADRIFMLEQYGSEVAILPLDPSAAPVRESTGRGGIKVAQSVGAVTLGVATMFATGGTLVAAPFPSYRHTSMVSDANAGRLYALNKGTRDVTIFRTADLKRLKSFAVGHNPTTLVRSAHSPYVLALAPSQITVLHTATDEQVLVEKGGKLVEALDGLDRFYFADTSGMRIYSISELAVVAEHAAFANAYSVVAPRPEP
ncbi:MAG: hypothetical protein OES38_18700, partial [Gammaproteobacteria bacterium]|nr:hypothetical protein [Gammaproteobacteria bacterium]